MDTQMKCPSCGAPLEGGTCSYCGYTVPNMAKANTNMDQNNNAVHQQNNSQKGTYPPVGSVQTGMNPQQGVYNQQGIDSQRGMYQQQNTIQQQNRMNNQINQVQPKKRKTWLWVLGWIFCFPIPLSILIWRIKVLKPWFKVVLIALLWIIVLLIGRFRGNNDSTTNRSTSIQTDTVTTTESRTEATTKATTETKTDVKEDAKEKKNAFETGEVSEFVYEGCTFSVPDYFIDNKDENRMYAEKGDSLVVLQFQKASVAYKEFSEDEYDTVDKEFVDSFVDGMKQDNTNTVTNVDYKRDKINGIDCILLVYNIYLSEYQKTLDCGYCFYDINGEYVIAVGLSCTYDCKYDYNDDYVGVLKSIVIGDDSITKEVTDDNEVTPEVKEFLDSYEEFMDDYIEFMESYDSSDAAQLVKYAELLADYADFSKKIEEMDDKEMSDADNKYYIEVTTRVSKKLMDASINTP
ncbi:MAG: zinc ribbon domain-containing protein [Eubacterium sp.]|nr:zinc ribbon domain-containing protein [Eubacterium sp.]